MADRIMVHITDLLDVAAGDDALENRLAREVRELADELNSSLLNYEVRLVHLDTADYLEFIGRDPADVELPG